MNPMFCSQCGNETTGQFCTKCGAARSADSTLTVNAGSSASKLKSRLLIAFAVAITAVIAVVATLTIVLPTNSATKISLDGKSAAEIIDVLIADGFCPTDSAAEDDENVQACMTSDDFMISVFASLTPSELESMKTDALSYLFGEDWIILHQHKKILEIAEKYESTLFLRD